MNDAEPDLQERRLGQIDAVSDLIAVPAAEGFGLVFSRLDNFSVRTVES